jgi:hypothetical protein
LPGIPRGIASMNSKIHEFEKKHESDERRIDSRHEQPK